MLEELKQLWSQTRQADNQQTISSGWMCPPLGSPSLPGASLAVDAREGAHQPVCAPRPGLAGWAPESPVCTAQGYLAPGLPQRWEGD